MMRYSWVCTRSGPAGRSPQLWPLRWQDLRVVLADAPYLHEAAVGLLRLLLHLLVLLGRLAHPLAHVLHNTKANPTTISLLSGYHQE
jgi:hypothetical protein